MKKQFLSLGKALNKIEQRVISGGKSTNDGACGSCNSAPGTNSFKNGCGCNSGSDCCSGNCSTGSIWTSFKTCRAA